MTPEQGTINPSSLIKFIKLRLKDTDLLNLSIDKTVSIAMDRGIIGSMSIIVDTTHTVSSLNPFSTIQVLKQRSKILRKAVYIVDEGCTERMQKKYGRLSAKRNSLWQRT